MLNRLFKLNYQKRFFQIKIRKESDYEYVKQIKKEIVMEIIPFLRSPIKQIKNCIIIVSMNIGLIFFILNPNYYINFFNLKKWF